MKRCEDCGKKLRLIESYRHPIKGKDFLLCSSCFDTVQESIFKWREANLPYVGFFKNNSSKKNYQLNLKKEEKRYPHLSKLFHNILPSENIRFNVK